MNKKILSGISMSLGIGLSCITNLITGDNSVVTWFNHNKTLVVVLGIILTICSIMISYLSETENATENNVQRNNLKLFTNTFLNSIWMLVAGLLLGFVYLWLLSYFGVEKTLANQLTILIVGFSAGTEFRFVGGNALIGAIVGAFLALAFSYYFPENFKLEFLPSWLNEKTIISSGFFAAIIGLYTGIYKQEIIAKEKAQRTLDAENNEKDAEAFHHLKKFFAKYNYELLSSNFADDTKRIQYQVIGANKEVAKDYIAKLQEKKASNELTGFQFFKNIAVELMKGSSSIVRLKPPFYLYDNNLSLVKKFSTVAEIKTYVEKNEIEHIW